MKVSIKHQNAAGRSGSFQHSDVGSGAVGLMGCVSLGCSTVLLFAFRAQSQRCWESRPAGHCAAIEQRLGDEGCRASCVPVLLRVAAGDRWPISLFH